jgi:aspartate/methionine/tyrosine aminotransferase
LVAGKGVRELLSTALKNLRARRPELWLPQDVYPVYWELAAANGLAPVSFQTLPEVDWNFLGRAAANAVILVPLPLSPLGRMLHASEVDGLIRWLRGGDRLLLVDSVYTYDFASSRPILEALLATKSAVILGSCSKSWLSTRALGIASTTDRLIRSLFEGVDTPSLSDLAEVIWKLEQHPDLPRLQQEAFQREWHRIEPRLRACDSRWDPPKTGYFSVVEGSFERLLERSNLLGVPASVFGSREPLTVVTCLHDLAVHEVEARSA